MAKPEHIDHTARKLTIGSTLRLASQIAAAGSAFALTPLVMRHLGDQLYGIWSVVGAAVTYTSLLEMGMTSTMTRFLSRAIGAGRQDECNLVFSAGARIYGVIAGVVLLLGGLTAALAPVIWRHSAYAGLSSQLILVFTVGSAAFFSTRIFTGALSAELRYDHVAVADLCAILVRAGATICVLLAGYGPVALAWASVTGWAVYLVVAAYFTHRDLPALRFHRSLPPAFSFRALFSYTRYAFLSQLSDMLRYQADAFVTASFIGVAAVTHYRVAGMITLYVLQALNPAVAVFQPVFSRQEARNDYASIQKTFLFASKIALSAASFAAFVMIFWGNAFIERWIGRAYLDAYPCLVVLAVGCALAVSSYPGVDLLYGTSNHKFYAVLTATEAVANVVLSIALARKYGILGVALGTVIPMFFIRALIQPVYVCLVARIPYRKYAANMIRHFGLIAACLFLTWIAAARHIAPNYLQLVLTAVLAAASFLVLQWFLLFDSGERSLFIRMLGPLTRRKCAAADE